MNEDATEADAIRAEKYLRKLLERGVPNTDAVNMTSSYISSVLSTRAYYDRLNAAPGPRKSQA